MGGNIGATVLMGLTGYFRGISDHVFYPLICIQLRAKRKIRGIQAIVIFESENFARSIILMHTSEASSSVPSQRVQAMRLPIFLE